MKIARVIGIILLALSPILTAQAEEEQRYLYLEGKGGFFMYTGEDRDVAEDGPAYGINVGYRLNEIGAIEFSYLGSRSSGTDEFGLEEADWSTNLFTIGARLSLWAGQKENHEFYTHLGLGGGSIKLSEGNTSVSESGLVTQFGFGYLFHVHAGAFAFGPGFAVHTLNVVVEEGEEQVASLFLTPLVMTLEAKF
jgi:hypothetical protein